MIIKRYKQLIALVSGLTLIVLILTTRLYWQEQHKSNVEVVFLDIGQGDSILIKTKYNQQILIDGGPNSAILGKLQKLMPFYDRTIDLVILTHPDKDHMEGLLEVLQRYKVNYILWTGIKRDGPLYQKWLMISSRLEKQ